MAVAHTISMDSEIPVIGFSSNGTKNRNAFVVVNTSTNKEKPAVIEIKGTTGKKFRAFRTNGDNEEYTQIGVFDVVNGEIVYNAPVNSATTFFEE